MPAIAPTQRRRETSDRDARLAPPVLTAITITQRESQPSRGEAGTEAARLDRRRSTARVVGGLSPARSKPISRRAVHAQRRCSVPGGDDERQRGEHVTMREQASPLVAAAMYRTILHVAAKAFAQSVRRRPRDAAGPPRRRDATRCGSGLG